MSASHVIDLAAPLTPRPARRLDEHAASWGSRVLTRTGSLQLAPTRTPARTSAPTPGPDRDLCLTHLTAGTTVTLDLLTILLKELTTMETMLDLDIEALDTHLAEIRALLKEGLLSMSIWARQTGLSLVDYNPSHVSIALFNRLTDEIHSTLSASGFPGLNRYYFIDLEDGQSVLILCHGQDLMEGFILDSRKTNLGILLSVAVPKSLRDVEAAIS